MGGTALARAIVRANSRDRARAGPAPRDDRARRAATDPGLPGASPARTRRDHRLGLDGGAAPGGRRRTRVQHDGARSSPAPTSSPAPSGSTPTCRTSRFAGRTDSCDDVVLVGRGMANSAYGGVPHGIWIGNARQVLIANLTIRDVYFHPIQLDPAAGAQAPRIYNVRLVDAGEQFIKSSANSGAGPGVNDGIVEYSVMEYTTTARSDYTNGVDVHQGARWIVRAQPLPQHPRPGRAAGRPGHPHVEPQSRHPRRGQPLPQRPVRHRAGTGPGAARRPRRRHRPQQHLPPGRRPERRRRHRRSTTRRAQGAPQHGHPERHLSQRDRVPVPGDHGDRDPLQPLRWRRCSAGTGPPARSPAT